MPRPLKVTLWIIGGLIGAFLLLGIIGAILEATGVIEAEDEAATITTTTATTTTTEAPTGADISAALQEMFADWTEQDCADEAVWYREFYTPQESAKRAAMLEDIEAGRFMEAEWDYWELWGMTTAALDDFALWMEVCATKSSPALVAEVEAFPSVVQEVRGRLGGGVLRDPGLAHC
ncbi:MAG: hypothetical protein F4Y13_09710 [Acidimicrobiaceae bacterium]|nr:hypothetical protein [Acidimicrobiaceae bacterium]MYH44115.1 hypothetical protein [Acidimicrobiaceae bacterium]